jgi:hypothetical protein
LVVVSIKACAGIGASPFWIAKALVFTDGDSATPPGPTAPAAAADTDGVAAPAVAGATGGGWLMTVLMTVVLWMLLKMTLFGGGAT